MSLRDTILGQLPLRMKWRIKVAGFKALSSIPGGKALYRFAQKNLTGSLRPTEARVGQKIDVGLRYFDWLCRHGHGDFLLKGTHVDLGAGWHPTIPLLYYALGVKRQLLFDVSPLLDQELVEQTVQMVLSIVQNPSWSHRTKLVRLPPPVGNTEWEDYLANLGIEYQAPYNGAWHELSGSLDVVTSTQVLLHIPKPVLAQCFAEIHRSLKPGGFFFATVHLRDLIAGIQPGVSKYNQLRYSTETWERWVNSPLMSYNRLRAPDYRQLLTQVGFELPGFEVEHGSPDDLAELDQIPIADCFRQYSREDLAAKHLFFAAQKR